MRSKRQPDVNEEIFYKIRGLAEEFFTDKNGVLEKGANEKLSRHFGYSVGTIYNIANNATWEEYLAYKKSLREKVRDWMKKKASVSTSGTKNLYPEPARDNESGGEEQLFLRLYDIIQLLKEIREELRLQRADELPLER